MGIKIKQLDKDSALKKVYLPFERNASACAGSLSSVYLKLIVCPVDGHVDGVTFSNRVGITGSAGAAIHIVVTNQTLGSDILDWTKTGVTNGQSSEARWVVNTSENNVADVCADSVITVLISTSDNAGLMAGYVEVTVSDDNAARVDSHQKKEG